METEELIKKIATIIKDVGDFHDQDMAYTKDKKEGMKWWNEKYKNIATKIVVLLEK